MRLKVQPGMLIPLVTGLAVVFVVVYPSYFATLDGPQQVYAAYVLKTWPTLSAWYEPSVPMASAGYPAIFFPLTLVMPWTWAQRLSLGLMALLWNGATIALIRSLDPRRTIVAVVGGSLVLGWSLAMGFFSFLMGTAISVWALAASLDAQSSRKSAMKTQILLSLAVSAHLFAGALGIGAIASTILFLDCSFRDKLVRWTKHLAIPTVLVLLLVYSSRQEALPPGDNSYLAGSDRLLSIFKMGFGGPLWRALPPTLIAAFAAARCFALGHKKLGDRREWGLALFVIACLVVALFAPLHMPGWMHFAPRFLPLPLLIGIALLRVEHLSKEHMKLATSGIVAFALASIAWFGNHFHQLSVSLEPLLGVTRAPIQATGFRLPILGSNPWFVGIDSMSIPFPFADPAFNLPLLAAVEQGGVVPYTFTTRRTIHPFLDKRDHPPVAPIPAREHYWLGLLDPRVQKKPDLRRSVLIDMAWQSSRFEGVILFGSPEDQKIFDTLGFESQWRSDSGYLATFKGCPVTLGIKSSKESPTKLIASYGWFPMMKSAWSQTIHREEALTKVSLPGAPCGPIWVEVTSDESSVICAGAGPDGRLLAHDRTNQKGILCPLQTKTP